MATAILTLAALASIGAFLAMGFDKWSARRGARRIPESTLHGLELLGGWPGSLLGQRLFRHKTIKPAYRVRFWGCVVVHLLAVAVALWQWGR